MCNCLKPIEAWRCGETVCKSDGVVSPNLVFNRHKAESYFWSIVPSGDFFKHEPILGAIRCVENQMRDNLILIPCGKCAVCQMNKRKDMATRLTHEASQHDNCCFITLTYKTDSVPISPKGKLTLAPRDVQLFMKRLRRHLEYVPRNCPGVRDHVERIRYFAVGEYGGRTQRPHYHIIIFGWNPSDKVLLKVHNGRPVYRSAQVEKLWTNGFITVSDVSPYVARYCARYVTKKFSRIEEYHSSVDDRFPEFCLQSTRDGAIGATWFDKYGVQSCLNGFVTYRVDDKIFKASVPKYYYTRLRRKHLPIWLRCREEKLAFISRNTFTFEEMFDHIQELKRKVDVFRLKLNDERSREVF